jgi:hypothetical protein
MDLHIPDGNDDETFGPELFSINGNFSLMIGSYGLQLFANGKMQVGSSNIELFDIAASGVLIINSSGVAGDVQVSVDVGNVDAIKNFLSLEVSSRLVFNTTGQNRCRNR